MESDLASHILEARHIRGWGQRELGRRAGVSGATISNVESGATQPTNETIVKIARALNEKPESLLRLAGYISKPPPPTSLDEQVAADFRTLTKTQRSAVATLVQELAANRAEHAPTAPFRPAPAAETEEHEHHELSQADQEELSDFFEREMATRLERIPAEERGPRLNLMVLNWLTKRERELIESRR